MSERVLHYFQHESWEGLGTIADWARERGISMTRTAFYEANPHLPDPASVEGLIIMGGPMGVYEQDKYSWLAPEIDCVRAVIEAGKPVLGICLGSQIIAAGLGAKVYPAGKQEIGWFPIEKLNDGLFLADLAERETVFHWHGDTFDLPKGAKLLARNEATTHQAFEYKRALGLQFHLEVGPPEVEAMLDEVDFVLPQGVYVQDAVKISTENRFFDVNRTVLFSVLDKLFPA